MELLHQMLDVVLHLDVHLNQWAATLGPWVYALLFAIIFCETGLVVTPFLPGDSLLFAIGALTATEGSVLHLPLIIPLLIIAAVAGDAVNYGVGHRIGRRAFSIDSRFLNHQHLVRTQTFYEKHGGKTIILARFIPIIRTFAPFVAGIGAMRYARFALFNVTGAIAWVVLIVVAGHLVGDLPWVKRNFESVILGIIVVSLIPPVLEALRARRDRLKAGPPAEAAD